VLPRPPPLFHEGLRPLVSRPCLGFSASTTLSPFSLSTPLRTWRPQPFFPRSLIVPNKTKPPPLLSYWFREHPCYFVFFLGHCFLFPTFRRSSRARGLRDFFFPRPRPLGFWGFFLPSFHITSSPSIASPIFPSPSSFPPLLPPSPLSHLQISRFNPILMKKCLFFQPQSRKAESPRPPSAPNRLRSFPPPLPNPCPPCPPKPSPPHHTPPPPGKNPSQLQAPPLPTFRELRDPPWSARGRKTHLYQTEPPFCVRVPPPLTPRPFGDTSLLSVHPTARSFFKVSRLSMLPFPRESRELHLRRPPFPNFPLSPLSVSRPLFPLRPTQPGPP